MFGMGTLPVKKVDFESDDTFDAEAFASNPAFQSDAPEEDIPDTPHGIPEEIPEEPEIPEENGYYCDSCGVEINERVYDYSLNKFGRPLCIKCQRGGGR